MKILNDFSTSVRKALEEIDPKYESYKGLVVCGTHSPHDVDSLLAEIQTAREQHLPFLGICFGHQLAAIEYARNVLGIEDATSEEFSEKGTFVVKRLQNLKVGLYPTQPGRLDTEYESYWNNYEVVAGFRDLWKKEDNFITCQFHPEYQNSKDRPHKLLVQFLNYAKVAV